MRALGWRKGSASDILNSVYSVGSPAELSERLSATGYLADDGLATIGYLALTMQRPLLLEGEPGTGKTALAEALAIVDKTGDRMYEAELYWLKGQLMLQSQVSSAKSQVEKEAEECFWKAIEIARKQQAKSLELRAAMSLSRLEKALNLVAIASFT